MKGLIMGGGIAGLSTAMALRAMGIDVEVHERRPGPPREEGLFLTLGVNGLRALEQLGALDAVLERKVVETPGIVFESTSGRTLGRSSNGTLDGRVPAITLMRGALLCALEDEARKRGIPIHYGGTFTSVRVEAGPAVVAFADRTEARGDFVVGADGIHSAVRQAVDPTAPAPSFTGLVNLGGVCRCPRLPPTPGEMRMLWGRHAFMGYTVEPDGTAWWFANVPVPGGRSLERLRWVSDAAWRDQLLALFRDDPAFTRDLISNTERIHAYPILDLADQPSSWSRGPVVLVGDAAHAVAPSTGQGASLAVEDALDLALALRQEADMAQAFAAFERDRRPRAQRLLQEGRRRGAYKAPPNEFARILRDLIMPLALRVFASERRLSWIHDYEVPWPTGGPAPSFRTTEVR